MIRELDTVVLTHDINELKWDGSIICKKRMLIDSEIKRIWS